MSIHSNRINILTGADEDCSNLCMLETAAHWSERQITDLTAENKRQLQFDNKITRNYYFSWMAAE